MSSGLGVAVHELRHLPAALLAGGRCPHRTEQRALRGINSMLHHVVARVPYYCEHPGYAGPPPASLSELSRLPLLDKPAVLAAGVDRFCTPGLRPARYREEKTSGSTGRVLVVRHDINAYGYHGATLVRRFLTSGYRPWWRIAQIKGFDRPTRWFQRMGIFPRTVVPAGLPIRQLAERVLQSRPHLVMGYPVMLRALLRELSAGEITALRRSLRLVMSDSELLTEQVARLLAEGFGVPVFDEYSAAEVLTVAVQCRAGSMHVDEDRVWLEIVDDAGQPVPDGEAGMVVVTHFRERAMPLVRFRTGDRGRLVPGGCSCGRRFRRMQVVDGRTNDYLVIPGSGRRVYSALLLVLATETPGVAECMMRQDASGAITVHLVPERPDQRSYEEAAALFATEFARQVDPGVTLRFVRAERVELSVGGKGRVLESAYRPGPGGGAADSPPAAADSPPAAADSPPAAAGQDWGRR